MRIQNAIGFALLVEMALFLWISTQRVKKRKGSALNWRKCASCDTGRQS
jgi:hypothetical protein